MRENRVKYLKGEYIGVFKFIKDLPKNLQPSGRYERIILVECPVCKNPFKSRPGNLLRKNSKSCKDCANNSIGQKVSKHKKCSHPLYFCWHDLKNRCNNQNYKHYNRYGGRGIKVCSEWENDFIEFYKWAIKNGWKKGLQIDRINNDLGYFPKNCRFVKPVKNVRNSTIVKLDYDTVLEIKELIINTDLSDNQISKKYNVSRSTIYDIRNRKTWKDVMAGKQDGLNLKFKENATASN
ncbi:hypothetical protein [Tenacibaculum sp.]|uniref:hypothetical protein n=1 Tax=Tenacibaculum sp. TaxID=1906242 RepID=UPI003D13213C